MKFVMVRHGETIENRKKLSQGWIGGTLTPKGVVQAKELAKSLSDLKFDIIYCSDLARAKDTLKEIIKYHKGTPVKYTAQLRERSKGVFEGKPLAAMQEQCDKDNISYWDYKPEGGEGFEDIAKRAVDFFEKMKKEHKADSVLWVTHGGIIYQIMHKVLGLSNEENAESPNGAITVIETDGSGNVSVKRHNSVDHLS